MAIRLTGAIILSGALLVACAATGPAAAAPIPALQGGTPAANDITLVGQGPGGVGGGGVGRGGGPGGARHATIGRGGGKQGASRGGGGGGGGARHATINRGGGKPVSGGGKPRKYAYSGPNKKYAYPRGYRPYGRYRYYPRYRYYGWYGGPFGYSSGSCAWLYRKAVATNSRYWWDRYNACIGNY